LNILTHSKTNAPRRNDQGARMWCCPSYIGDTPKVKTHSGCSECSKKNDHNIAEDITVVVPFGTPRYNMIPIAQRQDVISMNRIDAALFLWNYVINGYIGNDIIFNAGAANNASQKWEYEIVSCGQGYMDIRGPNPKVLTAGISRLNPEWPLPDPITGGTSLIISELDTGILPTCVGSVEFHYPSVLWNKAFPLITRIDPPVSNNPNNVTFRVYFDDGFNATNAISPYDTLYPSHDGIYRCAIRFEYISPQKAKDYQAPKEIQVTKVTKVFSGPGNIHQLTNSAGGATRVIMPEMDPESFAAQFDPEIIPAPSMNGRVSTNKTISGYESEIDLSDLTYDEVTITYYSESIAGDKPRCPVVGQCSKSKTDRTGSYKHGSVQHCANTESTGFQNGLYHDYCWLPGKCSGFTLQDESLDTIDEYSHIGSLWTRAYWIISQSVPGFSNTRNFQLSQMGGASIEGLCGSFCDKVHGGRFSAKEEFFPRSMGKRVTWSNDNNEYQALLHGAFYLSPYEHDEEDMYYRPSAFGGFQTGIIAELVSNWSDGKNTNVTRMPWRYCSMTNVYSFTTGGSSLAKVNTPMSSESYIVSVDVDEVGDTVEAERIKAIY
jgi:hypothetical protein